MKFQDKDILFTDDISRIEKEDLSADSKMLFLYCRRGRIMVKVDGVDRDIEGGEFLICLPGKKITVFLRNNETEAVLLRISEAMANHLIYDCLRKEALWWEKQKFVDEHVVARPDEGELEVLESYINIITIQFKRKMTTKRISIIKSLADAAIYEIMSALDSRVQADEEQMDQILERGDYILHSFLELLRTEGVVRHTVAWYAQKLCISSKYLSVLCKEKGGSNASEMIKQALLKEICYQLANTNLTIKEISYNVGFQDVSVMCRFFNKNKGMSPSRYRVSLTQQTV
ncbi:MAG: helix-turn-helix domain-containing protein [Candidatus Cryptobacteroides sp.]